MYPRNSPTGESGRVAEEEEEEEEEGDEEVEDEEEEEKRGGDQGLCNERKGEKRGRKGDAYLCCGIYRGGQLQFVKPNRIDLRRGGPDRQESALTSSTTLPPSGNTRAKNERGESYGEISTVRKSARGERTWKITLAEIPNDKESVLSRCVSPIREALITHL
ncbi:hypothetical protein EAI_14258 [Harpegnathos saltator]|uniref:Uncharacterized protein n=1 Tax=Harpegnathos saltator TaxID=610380 RepID=E2BRC7_HARSA|nr:hypothetical protein EAI_14258 [Harpegnathos saltator]